MPARVYADPTQTNWSPWKWFTMVGRAVATAPVSSAARNVAIMMESIDIQNDADLGGGSDACAPGRCATAESDAVGLTWSAIVVCQTRGDGWETREWSCWSQASGRPIRPTHVLCRAIGHRPLGHRATFRLWQARCSFLCKTTCQRSDPLLVLTPQYRFGPSKDAGSGFPQWATVPRSKVPP